MHQAVVQQMNRSGAGKQLSVKFGESDAARDARGVLHSDLVDGGMVTKLEAVSGPVTRDAGINRKRSSAHPETQDSFHSRAVDPSRRTGVPGPSAAADVWRFGVDIPCNDVGLNLVALHVGASVGAVDGIHHAE